MAPKVLYVQAHRDLVYQGRPVSRGEVFEMNIIAALQAARRGEVTGAPRPKVRPVVPDAPVAQSAPVEPDAPPAVALDPPQEELDTPAPDPAVDSFDVPDDEQDQPSPQPRAKRRYRRRDLQADEA